MHTHLVHAVDAFSLDPFIGCPFDKSEMTLAQHAAGLRVNDAVEFDHVGHDSLTGTVVAIGENAKYGDGTVFTAFLIRRGDAFVLKTHKEVRAARH